MSAVTLMKFARPYARAPDLLLFSLLVLFEGPGGFYSGRQLFDVSAFTCETAAVFLASLRIFHFFRTHLSDLHNTSQDLPWTWSSKIGT